MKVYVLIETSNGEVPNSLDTVRVFKTEEDALTALKNCYEDILDMVDGYDFIENEFDGSSYLVQIEDSNDTIYEGFVKVHEVE